MPSSKGSFQPRDWTWVSCIGRQILDSWATGEASSPILWFRCICLHLCFLSPDTQRPRPLSSQRLVLPLVLWVLFFSPFQGTWILMLPPLSSGISLLAGPPCWSFPINTQTCSRPWPSHPSLGAIPSLPPPIILSVAQPKWPPGKHPRGEAGGRETVSTALSPASVATCYLSALVWSSLSHPDSLFDHPNGISASLPFGAPCGDTPLDSRSGPNFSQFREVWAGSRRIHSARTNSKRFKSATPVYVAQKNSADPARLKQANPGSCGQVGSWSPSPQHVAWASPNLFADPIQFALVIVSFLRGLGPHTILFEKKAFGNHQGNDCLRCLPALFFFKK